MPLILYRYIAIQYTLSILLVLSIFSGLILFFDILELARITYKLDITIQKVIEMCIMKNYSRIQKIWPFIILIATIITYRKLNSRNELISMKVSGLSMLQILYPAIFTVALFSLLHIFILHQVSANLLERYQHYEARLLKGNDSLISIAHSGLWLRHAISDGNIIIHGRRISVPNQEIHDVNMYFFDKSGTFSKRIDSERVVVSENHLIAYNTLSLDKSYHFQNDDQLILPLHVQFAQIADNLMLPETMTILRLFDFIIFAQESGFISIKYQIYLMQLLFSPFMWFVMLLLGYSFCSTVPRLKKTGSMAFSMILICLALYFVVDFFSALAMINSIPVLLAVIGPIFIAGTFSYYCVLHYEAV